MKQLKIETSITDRQNLALDKYLADVSRERMITVEEEVELARRIKGGDTEALDKMVRANLRFVISVAKQYQGHGMPLGDMISEGNLGLIKAAHRFDETRGFKFISYAVWWIRQYIIYAISQHSRTVRLPVNQMGNMYKIRKAAMQLEQKFEREPTLSELAELTTFPETNVQSALSYTQRMMSIDMEIGENEGFCLGDLLTDSSIPPTDQGTLNASLTSEVQRALSSLNPAERDVLSMNFGFGADEMSLTSIALRMNLSKERVRQIKARALKTLAKTLRSDLVSYLQ